MPVGHLDPGQLADLTGRIDRWAAGTLRTNALLLAADRDPQQERWYLRMRGEDKSFITVWLTLRPRTLHFESYFMPAPEEQIEACLAYLLRVNPKLYAWRFAIGEEDALYLLGQLPVTAVDEDELDRILGCGYAYSEQYFRAAMRIGYATRYRG